MRITHNISLAVGIFCFCAPTVLRAELLSQALLSFPASTKSLEYDNLAQLRRLPNYQTLRKQYSGASLERAQATLATLGITEESIQEVVSTVGSADFYGIVSGSFSGIQAGRRAAKVGFHQLLVGKEQAQCSATGVCVMFLEDSLAAFGGAKELQAMLQARQGTSPRLGAETAISELLSKADLRAPVIGIAPGSDLSAWIGDGVANGLLSQADLSKLLDNISLFQYSVKIDDRAHVNLNLACASSLAAVALRGSLSALNAMHSLSNGDAASTFEHLTVSSNEKLVHLTLDARIN
jgi:hypothetical protein